MYEGSENASDGLGGIANDHLLHGFTEGSVIPTISAFDYEGVSKVAFMYWAIKKFGKFTDQQLKEKVDEHREKSAGLLSEEACLYLITQEMRLLITSSKVGDPRSGFQLLTFVASIDNQEKRSA